MGGKGFACVLSRKFLVCLILIFLLSILAGQAYAIPQPTDLSSYLGGYGRVRHPKDDWVVFADRTDTPLWNNADCTGAPIITVPFMTKYHVVSTAGHVLELRIPREDNVVLWTRDEYLLLSQEPFISNTTFIQKKAVLLNDLLGAVQGGRDAVDSEMVRLYDRPSRVGAAIATEGMMNLFYIYKKLGDWLLIGRDDHVDVGCLESDTCSRTMMSWVEKSHVLEWDTRQGLWYAHGQSVPFYKNEDFSNDNGIVVPAPSNPGSLGDRMAYPVSVYNAVGHYAEISYHGQLIVNATGHAPVIIDPDLAEHLTNTVNSLYVSSQNMHVVFAIDGTRSMGPYIRRVASLVTEISNRMSQTFPEGKLTYSAVVFRDSQSVFENSNRPRLVETFPSGDSIRLSNWLQNIQPSDDTNDRDYKEALYLGIDRALNLFHRGNYNVLFVISDAGDNGRDLPAQYVAGLPNKFLDKNVFYSGGIWLVHPGGDGGAGYWNSLRTFPIDMRGMFTGIRNRITNRYTGAARVLDQDTSFSAIFGGDLYAICEDRPSCNSVSDVLAQGVERTNELGVQGLGTVITRTLLNKRESQRELAESISRILTGTPTPGGADQSKLASLVAMVEERLRGQHVQQADVENMLQALIHDNARVHFKAWVRTRIDGHNTMEPYVLISQNDLSGLMYELKKMTSYRQISDFQEAWRARMQGVVPEGAFIADFLRILYGPGLIRLNDATSILSKNPDNITQEELDRLISIINESGVVNRLNSILNMRDNEVNSYGTSWKRYFDLKFIWLPERALP